MIQADFRCCLAAGFLAAVSFACFLPAIGISISFWPAAAFRGFLADFFGAVVSAAAPRSDMVTTLIAQMSDLLALIRPLVQDR